jgi:hypothetical protein
MSKYPIYLTGEEQDYFDFLPCIRASIRTAHMYTMRREVEKYVWDSHYWQNPDWIRNRLSTYFIIQLAEKPSKKRRKKDFNGGA